MEYISGGELYSRLKEVGRFKEKQAAEIIKNICLALNHIHSNNYVHRDIKLENVLMVDKCLLNCKLIDFGFAEKINYHKLTSKAGTPGFLAPELF